MTLQEVYLGLGGNMENTPALMHSALAHLDALPAIDQLSVSSFYLTTPVSDLPQPPYINAACRFRTSFKAPELLAALQKIEILHGKTPKPKNAPRPLDLDILFFGTEMHTSPQLEIPHPKWQERLFVLIPLADLTSRISIPCIQDNFKVYQIDLNLLIQSFHNIHGERVIRLTI